MPDSAITDILVIGAGPAGATLARCLAAAGRDVLLVEKQRLPRHKACGGGLPPRAVSRLGLDLAALGACPVARVCLKGAWSGPQTYPLHEADACWVVDRAQLDHALVKQAQAQGAKLQERCALRNVERTDQEFVAQTSAGTIQARIVCACDGAFSPTARTLDFPANALGFCVEALVPMPANTGDTRRTQALFDLTCRQAGYGWAFPRGSVYAVGLGGAQPHAPDLPRDLRAFVHALPGLHRAPLQAMRGGMLPDFRGARETYAHDGAYLVGDAAGLVDPLTGEGIFYAIRSAELAAQAILHDGEAQYEVLLAEELLPELTIALRLARRFRRTPCWLRGLLMSLPPFRRHARHFVDILFGRSSYRTLR